MTFQGQESWVQATRITVWAKSGRAHFDWCYLASQNWLLWLTSQAKLVSCQFDATWVTRGHFNCQTSSSRKPCTPVVPITTLSIESFAQPPHFMALQCQLIVTIACLCPTSSGLNLQLNKRVCLYMVTFTWRGSNCMILAVIPLIGEGGYLCY